jgi:iron donor protein CyaY
MTDSEYRLAVDGLLSRLDSAFEDVDPDLAESMYSQGTLVVTFPQGLKLIVSPQAPVQQIWAAFRDRAWHFGHDGASDSWLDDRGEGVELVSLVAKIAREQAGVEIKP